MPKKTNKTNARKLQELIGLALRVQTETDYCVFIRVSGHVEQIEIEIRESKENYHTEIISSTFYFKPHYRNVTEWEDWYERKYRKVRNVLLSILETGEVDFNHEDIETDEIVVVSYKHTF